MYLVEDVRDGATTLVFTWYDPSKDGWDGTVTGGVELDYDMEAIFAWADGEDRPEARVGRDPSHPKRYKVFKYERECRAAGYEPVAGMPAVFGTWLDYLRARRPEDLPEEEWLDALDRQDAAARRRREREGDGDAPKGGDRDDVAAWVARVHLRVDPGVQQVLYLPAGAPPDDIRFLEVNDRIARDDDPIQPIDLGLEVEGAKFRLLVADVTSGRLAQIKAGSQGLPPGWSLVNSVRLARRGR